MKSELFEITETEFEAPDWEERMDEFCKLIAQLIYERLKEDVPGEERRTGKKDKELEGHTKKTVPLTISE